MHTLRPLRPLALAVICATTPLLAAFTCNPAFDNLVFKVPPYQPPNLSCQAMSAQHARSQYYLPGWDGHSNIVSMSTAEVQAGNADYSNLGNFWLAVVSDAYYDAQGCSATSEPTHCVKRDPSQGLWVHILIRQSYWDSCPSPYSIKSRGAQAVGRAYGLGWSSSGVISVMHRPPNTDVPSATDWAALHSCTGLGYDGTGTDICPVP